jgi:hypothetical protein
MASYNPFDDDTLFPTAPVKAASPPALRADVEPYVPSYLLPKESPTIVRGPIKSEIHYLMTGVKPRHKTPYWLLFQAAYHACPDSFTMAYGGHFSGTDAEPHMTIQHTVHFPRTLTSGHYTDQTNHHPIRYHLYYKIVEGNKRRYTRLTDWTGIAIAEFDGHHMTC